MAPVLTWATGRRRLRRGRNMRSWKSQGLQHSPPAYFAVTILTLIAVVAGCTSATNMQSGPVTADWPTIPETSVQISAGGVTQARPPVNPLSVCTSGGGYRAMLFHTGVLWRLNELGLLSKIGRIAAVSGGSITAAKVGANWKIWISRHQLLSGLQTEL
jgi:hypothetical protein